MQRLGRYEIVEEVGRGGMGVVYRGLDAALGRTVAIKTVRLGEYATPQEVRTLQERLLREARTAGTLAHPNIVAVYDLGQEGDTTYVVMEFVHGRTLEEVLGESAPPPPEEWLLQVLEDAARALDYAHAHGVFHRDVKPSNIMVQDDGRVKVADFGIAKVAWAKTITETGMVMGSPHYMAPEQLKGEPVTARTDQFALAGVAYTVLSGRKPFDADTVASLFSKILHQDPPPVQALNPSLGAEVERALRKAMSKDPASRYESCTEFLGALKAARRRATQPVPPPPPKTRRPGWLPLAAVAACLLVLVALTAFFLLKSHQAAQAEIAYWDSIKGSKDAALFETYLKEFPSGRFSALARAQITALRTPANPPPPPVPAPKAVPEAPPPPKQAAPVTAKPSEVRPRETAPASRPTPGEVKTSPNDGQHYVWIPPGTFQMGCSPGNNQCLDHERPSHAVTITKGFWMGQTEVTVSTYQRFAQATGRSMPPAPNFQQDDSHPVVNVTWHDAAAYCQWAGGRLPTEAEWEYAARAGTTGPYYGALGAIAWYSINSGKQTHPVAQKEPNAFRLYDILGNVWEWVADWYANNYYAGSETRDPQGPPGGQSRVLRGGSWFVYPGYLRVSFRLRLLPGYRNYNLGCRCVREVIP